MQVHKTVSLGNLVISLSDAMDLANPALIQHQQRTAFVVWQLAKAAQFPTERLQKIFVAALLHDIGAFSLEEKLSLQNFETTNVEVHCIRGEILLNKTPWLRDSAQIVRFHHQDFNSWGESIENPLVFEAQILYLADYVERLINRRQYILHQHEGIIEKVKSLSGSSLHPQVIDLFLAVSHIEEFWLDLVSHKLYHYLFREGPFKRIDMGYREISTVSELYRNVIDFKSRFTSTHSSGVAASSHMLGRVFGFTKAEIDLLEMAGNLHDIGKLVISNSILDKEGKLTKEEMLVMKSHTYHTYAIVSTIGGIDHIAKWAAYHHEKLDGSGYPFRRTSDELSTGARILMVADIFTALAEDRPYRKGMSKEGIVQIIKTYAEKNLLDSRIVNLLFDNYTEIFSYVTEKQAIAREFYERQFATIP